MRRSQLFVKTRHQAPADETSKAVVEKIKQIVREEMNALGSSEILMTSLQRKELWEKTDRWDDK